MRTLFYSNVHKTKLYKLLDIQQYFRRTLRCFEGISVACEIEDDHISDMCYVILKVKLQCINVCERVKPLSCRNIITTALIQHSSIV